MHSQFLSVLSRKKAKIKFFVLVGPHLRLSYYTRWCLHLTCSLSLSPSHQVATPHPQLPAVGVVVVSLCVSPPSHSHAHTTCVWFGCLPPSLICLLVCCETKLCQGRICMNTLSVDGRLSGGGGWARGGVADQLFCERASLIWDICIFGFQVIKK